MSGQKQPFNTDLLLGIGFPYFTSDSLGINALYESRLQRTNYDEDSVSINLRWDF